MGEKQQLLDELHKIYEGDAWHGNSLGEILSGIPAAKAAVRPIPGAHSIWEIALHIAAWNETFTERLVGGVRPEPIDGDFPPIPDPSEDAWRRTLERVKASQEKLIEVVGDLEEERFPKQFANKDHSLSFFLHGIVRHVVYHSGQIGILKKA